MIIWRIPPTTRQLKYFCIQWLDKIHVKNCWSQKVENINGLLVQISSENGAPEPDRKHGKPKSLLQWCVPTWHGKGEKTLVEKMVENKNSGNRNMHHKGIGSHSHIYTWLRTGKSGSPNAHYIAVSGITNLFALHVSKSNLLCKHCV